ncbi:uncharacterized protein LY89DRAFT_348215 [Mollisia scopiformis]|uniref:Uncharacterized protein n=1 Tax=Mollisia scopiformis TaxID=149040 RepID=A0A132B6J6_MOLSC|nr:uncharacterized protein LY89DRAFT_348215 [Mollisia scopiformis]KUJ08025.1 hypothetical protein LY89DRAFT_348215 [Mollisia scopiformis]
MASTPLGSWKWKWNGSAQSLDDVSSRPTAAVSLVSVCTLARRRGADKHLVVRRLSDGVCYASRSSIHICNKERNEGNTWLWLRAATYVMNHSCPSDRQLPVLHQLYVHQKKDQYMSPSTSLAGASRIVCLIPSS